MRDSLYLAWQYLRYHRMTTAVLIASITLITFLPAGLQVIVESAEQHFRSRARATPLVIGPRGSPLELVLGSVYFDKPSEQVIRMEQLDRFAKQDFGKTIPLHCRFTARECQIVGTTEDYVHLRDLHTSEGRTWNIPGECVIGARAAGRLDVKVGDKIPVSSSPAFVVDDPPLRLEVVGVLTPTETPDDEAIFVNLETAWIIEGLGHGHADDAAHGSPPAKPYTDITPENVDHIHFHGDRATYPITSIIVVPASDKAEAMLREQFFSPEETAQIVRPRVEMDSLLETVLTVRSYFVTIVALVSVVTLLTIATVVVLSIQLRRAEIVTMSKMGCSRNKIASILGSQIALTIVASLAIAAVLTFATYQFGPELVRLLILRA